MEIERFLRRVHTLVFIIILENLYVIMPVLDFYYRFMCTIRVI